MNKQATANFDQLNTLYEELRTQFNQAVQLGKDLAKLTDKQFRL